MLKQFKRGIEGNLESDDFVHYEQGRVQEMGLLDEAIAEFRGLRAPEGSGPRRRSGRRFEGQFAVAEAILRRAVEGFPARTTKRSVAVLAGVTQGGRAHEARPFYQRALAVDINFMILPGACGLAGLTS
jgi:hypothetical protein